MDTQTTEWKRAQWRSRARREGLGELGALSIAVVEVLTAAGVGAAAARRMAASVPGDAFDRAAAGRAVFVAFTAGGTRWAGDLPALVSQLAGSPCILVNLSAIVAAVGSAERGH